MPRATSTSGILNVNKPVGPTSFDVVRLVKRLSGERRVGHAGTLDPAASGVLLVGLGQATRVLEYLTDEPKVYRASALLGISTDTQDAMGQVIATRDPSDVTRERLIEALAAFEGDQQQVPPMYSALKRQGRPLYSLARAGMTVERQARLVQIYRIDLLDWDRPSLQIRVECGKGTYIRSLVHDLGERLGCGAHLQALVRERVGPFRLADSVTLEDLQAAFEGGRWQEMLLRMDEALSGRRAVTIDESLARAVGDGKPLQPDEVRREDDGQIPPSPDELVRIYSSDGTFLAIGRYDQEAGLWRPEKVFHR